jgi:hypothetical protein
MIRRFPIRAKKPQPKKVACGGIRLNVSPYFHCAITKIIPLAKPCFSGIETIPVILNFPVRKL